MTAKRCSILLLITLVIAPAAIAQTPKTPAPAKPTDSAESRFRTGSEFLRAGRWQKAAVALERAAALSPSRADIQEALGGAYFNYAVDLNFRGPDTGKKAPANAQALWTEQINKLVSSAETALKKAVELQPKTADYHHTLGWFYMAQHWQHQFDAAADVPPVKELDQAAAAKTDPAKPVAAKPDDKPARPNYAKQATDELETASQLAPRVSDYYRSLGDAYRLIGDNTTTAKPADITDTPPALPTPEDRAQEQYRLALGVNPNSAALHYQFYNDLLREGLDTPAGEAMDHLRWARRLDPSNALYGYELAWNLFHEGRNAEAFNTLRYANLAPRLDMSYSPAYPRRLAAGLARLRIGTRSYSVHSRLLDLARSASVVAANMGIEDSRVALRASEEVARIGDHLAYGDEPLTRLIGATIVDLGLSDIEDISGWMGDFRTLDNVRVRRSQLRALMDSIQRQIADQAGQDPTLTTDQPAP